MSRASGDWLAFLDSDDEWLPDYLEKQAEAVAKYPGVIGSVMNCRLETGDGHKTDWFAKKRYPLLRGSRDIFLERPFGAVSRHDVAILDVCVFQRDVFLGTRMFDELLPWEKIGM